MKPCAAMALRMGRRQRTWAIGLTMFATASLLLGMQDATAQTRPGRIGMVSIATAWGTLATHRAFAEGMKEAGMVEGRDYVIEFRSIGDEPARFGPLSEELARMPVDVILVGTCGEWLDAARRATRTVPIVVVACNEDMIESGIVQSLNRPGGNVTGQTKLTPELAAKRLQMLKEALPSARRVAVLWNPDYSAFKQEWRELHAAAQKLGVTLEPIEFRRASDLEPAFAAMQGRHPDALMTFSDATVYVQSRLIGEHSATARLPSVFAFREVTLAGGLMSYGPSIPGMYRRSASQVAKILRGASPAEMPIEIPTRFELIVNQKAARALGITLPHSLLLRADEVID